MVPLSACHSAAVFVYRVSCTVWALRPEGKCDWSGHYVNMLGSVVVSTHSFRHAQEYNICMSCHFFKYVQSHIASYILKKKFIWTSNKLLATTASNSWFLLLSKRFFAQDVLLACDWVWVCVSVCVRVCVWLWLCSMFSQNYGRIMATLLICSISVAQDMSSRWKEVHLNMNIYNTERIYIYIYVHIQCLSYSIWDEACSSEFECVRVGFKCVLVRVSSSEFYLFPDWYNIATQPHICNRSKLAGVCATTGSSLIFPGLQTGPRCVIVTCLPLEWQVSSGTAKAGL
jgi:hypothetical protein